MRSTPPDKPFTITVCDKCLCASCWQGDFYCNDCRNTGTVEKTIAELQAMGLEHPHYWKPES